MRDAVVFEYETQSYNALLKTFSGGLTLQKVLKNMNKTMVDLEPKIFLYGVHERNTAAILITLNLWKPHIPQYSSAIVFELHERELNYYVKLRHYKGIPSDYETLILPGCTEYCLINKFIELNQRILQKNEMIPCFGPISNSKLIPGNENPIKWIYDKYDKMT